MMATEQRLIDANDALERLRKAEQGMKVVSIVGCKAVPMDGVIEFIQTRPTIEARPVVHGRWIAVPSSDMVTGKAHKCSECGKMRYGSFKPNYCGNCGADMKSKGD